MLTKVERLMYEEMAKDIARKLLRKGDDVDTVSECTSLPRDIVVQLVEDIAREKEQQ